MISKSTLLSVKNDAVIFFETGTYRGDGVQLGIDCGFWTDGASNPQLFWSVTGISPFSFPFWYAALPHDLAYAAELFTRSQCDNMLLEFCCMTQVSWYQRNAAYSAIRAGGGLVWSRHTKQTIADARKYVKLIGENEALVW